MANQVFNIAKGHVNEYVARVLGNDPAAATLVVVLFKVSEADATLIDYDLLSTLIAGSNTECDFDNYTRTLLTDSGEGLAVTVDDTNDRKEADFNDITITSAGGGTNNTLTKAVICYDPSSSGVTDSVMIPLTHHDFVVTTNGNDLIIQVDAAGFYRAA